MGRFLDMRTSENSSTFGSPETPVPIVPAAPALVGIIGLQTQGVAGTGTNGLIVQLAGTVAVSANGVSSVILNVQRGATVFGAGTVIYTAEQRLFSGGTSNVISIHAEDLAAPAAAETIYALFISATTAGAGTVVTRTGPESFSGVALNGLAATP